MSPTDRNKNNIKDSPLQEEQQQHHLQIVLVRTKTAAAALMPMKTTTTNITTNIAEQNRSTLSSSSSSASASTSTSTVQTRTGQTNNRIAWKTKLLLLFVKDSSYLQIPPKTNKNNTHTYFFHPAWSASVCSSKHHNSRRNSLGKQASHTTYIRPYHSIQLIFSSRLNPGCQIFAFISRLDSNVLTSIETKKKTRCCSTRKN